MARIGKWWRALMGQPRRKVVGDPIDELLLERWSVQGRLADLEAAAVDARSLFRIVERLEDLEAAVGELVSLTYASPGPGRPGLRHPTLQRCLGQYESRRWRLALQRRIDQSSAGMKRPQG